MTAHSITVRNARSYLAGTGATAALVVGAIIAFLSIGALVAFNGFPGGSETGGDSLEVGAPAAAAAAVGGAPRAVAAVPAPLPPAARAALVAAGRGGPEPPGVSVTILTPPTAGETPGVPTTTGTGVAPSATATATTTTGPVGGLADDVGVGPAANPVTDPVDQTLDQTAPGVGDSIDQIGQGISDTVGGQLNGGH